MVTTVMFCATHPEVETGLQCSRCEVAICPRCMVQTPVGARCRACARLKRPPMYEITAPAVLLGVATSLGLGAVIGAAWGLLRLDRLGFILIWGALFFGLPIGYFFADVVGRVTNRKRGPVMQGIAVTGLLLAWVVKSVVSGYGLGAEAFQADLFGLVLLAAVCAGAVTRLR
jgi:hypothetical protein